jgi:hypothetical protein
MKENRFEIVESTKKYKNQTAYSLQRCNIVCCDEVVSTLTLETELNVGKHSETFFAKETDIFLRMVNSLAKNTGYPVYNSVKI